MAKAINKLIARMQVYFSGKLTGKKFIPGIAWFFVTLILLCLPGKDLPKTDWWLDKIYFDKWVHTGLFGLLAILFTAPVFGSLKTVKRKWTYVLIIAFAVSAWGLMSEFIQYAFIEGRNFDLFDWAADSFGTLLGLFISKYFFLTPRRPVRNNQR